MDVTRPDSAFSMGSGEIGQFKVPEDQVSSRLPNQASDKDGDFDHHVGNVVITKQHRLSTQCDQIGTEG